MSDVLQEFRLDKAKRYLDSFEKNVEEAGGLPALWHDRTKMMTAQDRAKLGLQLGITGEGKYGPIETLKYVRENATAVAEHEGPSHFKDLGSSLITQSKEFEQQIDNMWTHYAMDILDTQGYNAEPPSAEQIAIDFKAGAFDETLSSTQKLLGGPENNLLQGYRDIQSEMAAYHIDMGQK